MTYAAQQECELVLALRTFDTDAVSRTATVTNLPDVVAAVRDAGITRIVVEGVVRGLPPLHLRPSQHLVGGNQRATLVFLDDVDGVRLSQDNTLAGLDIRVSASRRAVFNDTEVEHLGTLRLHDITTTGRVQIVASNRVRGGAVTIEELDILEADTRALLERPELLGVGVLQGAITIWNQQPDEGVVISAELRGVRVGSDSSPVRGSGVLVAGSDRHGGQLKVSVLETDRVVTDSGIADGSSDTICGGVFVVYGAYVENVHTRGPVTTHGVNSMVLDNWGLVDLWDVEAPLTSYGPTGVGFVNFGTIKTLRVRAPIETHGVGGRGFNAYPLDDTLRGPTIGVAEFDTITTHGDGAVAVQVGQSIGRLVVHGDIRTRGGEGDSLVRGKITRVVAHAISVQDSGHLGELEVDGEVASTGAGAAAVDVRGEIGAMSVARGIQALGAGADGIQLNGGTLNLRGTRVRAADGAAVRVGASGSIQLNDVDARGEHGDVVTAHADDSVSGQGGQ